jgi:hypothetical protein
MTQTMVDTVEERVLTFTPDSESDRGETVTKKDA